MAIAATIVIEDQKGRILFLLRRPNDRTISGFCLPGGKIDIDNESILDGLIRETKEETQYNLDKSKCEYLDTFIASNGITVRVYHTKVTHFSPLLSDEHIGYAWVRDWSGLDLAGNTHFGLKKLLINN